MGTPIMRVEQAFYGEDSRSGHGLRLFSGERGIASELTSRLDLPGTAPPKTEWSPFLSGFPWRDCFVLARTFLDVAAKRDGMVFSHALICPLDEFAEISDLGPFIRHLSLAPNWPQMVESLEIRSGGETPNLSSDELAAAAEALVSRGQGPVVRLGIGGFDELVASLWRQMWPDIRRSFAFRLSFSPDDIVETPPPALICTPSSLASRWLRHRSISATSKAHSLSMAARMLMGEPAASGFREFSDEIEAQLTRFSDLSMLESAFNCRPNVAQGFADSVTAMRLVETLSPDAFRGTAAKGRLARLLCDSLPSATPSEILTLRNLKLRAFADTGPVWKSLRDWTAKNRFLASDDVGNRSILRNALPGTGAIAEWRDAILAGFGDALLTESKLPEALWRWADADPRLIIDLLGQWDVPDTAESCLVKVAPAKLNVSPADLLAGFCSKRKWWLLHAAVVSAAYEPDEALRRQFHADEDAASTDALKLALRQASPRNVLQFARGEYHAKLLPIASEAAAAEPSLLASIDFSDMPAQRIWASAIALNPAAWKGPFNPGESFHLVLDRMICGEQIDAGLIVALSRTPVADVSRYRSRAKIWSMLEGQVRENLLSATASGWLEGIESFALLAVEPELQSAILRGQIDATLRRLVPLKIVVATQAIALFDQFGEDRFLEWLREAIARTSSFSVADAESIGRLILRWRWTRAVDKLVELNRRRLDVLPALRVCADMLSYFTRVFIGASRLSIDDKWRLLEDVASELYPSGPDHDAVWSRSGGRDCDLMNFGSGHSRWHDAIAKIRNGRGPRARNLLHQFQTDFWNNDKVGYLVKDGYFKDH